MWTLENDIFGHDEEPTKTLENFAWKVILWSTYSGKYYCLPGVLAFFLGAPAPPGSEPYHPV